MGCHVQENHSVDTNRRVISRPARSPAAEGESRSHLLLVTHVKPVRKKEILKAMKGYKDYSVALAWGLILKTPPPMRATRKGQKRNPWNNTVQRK